jgi:hypothetical protein
VITPDTLPFENENPRTKIGSELNDGSM